jgi:hypothetical protein
MSVIVKKIAQLMCALIFVYGDLHHHTRAPDPRRGFCRRSHCWRESFILLILAYGSEYVKIKEAGGGLIACGKRLTDCSAGAGCRGTGGRHHGVFQ